MRLGVGRLTESVRQSRSATANFGLFNQAISGQSDFLIESPIQRLQEKDLDDLSTLVSDPDWHLVPVIEGSVTALGNDGKENKQLKLIGLDLLSIGNLPNLSGDQLQFSDEDSQWYDWIGTENEVWVGRRLAEDLGLEEQSVIPFLASGHKSEMKVRMILEDQQNRLPDDLVLADLPTVQNLLSRPGELNRVEVIINQSSKREDKEYLSQIKTRLEAKCHPI